MSTGLNSSSEIKHSENNSLDKELDRIRLRRTDKNKKFPKTFDDVVLIFGLVAGIVFFGGVTLLSSGMLAGDSIILDETLVNLLTIERMICIAPKPPPKSVIIDIK